jgi:hypothetical protein
MRSAVVELGPAPAFPLIYDSLDHPYRQVPMPAERHAY